VQEGAVQCRRVLCSAGGCRAVQEGAVQCRRVPSSAGGCCAVQEGAVQCRGVHLSIVASAAFLFNESTDGESCSASSIPAEGPVDKIVYGLRTSSKRAMLLECGHIVHLLIDT
jgi:hypothetical protein